MDTDESGAPVNVVQANRKLHKAVGRQRQNIVTQLQFNYVVITAQGGFDTKPDDMEPDDMKLGGTRLPGNEDLLSVLDVAGRVGTRNFALSVAGLA